MSEDIDYYCGLYVDIPEDEKVFAVELANLLHSNLDKFNDLENSEVSISIWKNDEFNEEERANPENGFLFYRYKLEIEPNEELGEGNAVKVVSKILEYFWSMNYPAVASCDYEELLPNKGGYKNPNVPKPE